MIRPLSLSLAAALALSAASPCRAGENFPVVHNDPITVRIVSGKNGQPLGNLHLVLVGGYDQSDLHEQLYREEVLTDPLGKVRLSNQLANLPWLQVWVSRWSLCQSNPRKTSFSVELMRRDGLSAPNLCGPVSAQDAPGLFTVFVKNRAKKLKKGASVEIEMPIISAPKAAQAFAPMAAQAPAPQELPAAKLAPVESMSAAASSPVFAAAVAASSAETPLDVAPKADPIAPAPMPIFPALRSLPVVTTKSVAHPQARRVAARRAALRTRLVPVGCSARPPATKRMQKHPRAKPTAKAAPVAADNEENQKTPISATHPSKPLAGVRIAVKRHAHPTAPEKQE
jgi:hypothetical protein